jgi:SAM-dependent methyltransferase
VTACDLTPRMVELGRARSAAAGLDIAWVEADAEDLPFPAASFDVVVSAFGAIFAPRPERMAAELFRVVRPGDWLPWPTTPTTASSHASANSSPGCRQRRPASNCRRLTWGDLDHVWRRFDGLAEPGSVEIRQRIGTFEFGSVKEAVDFWHRTNPSQATLRCRVTDDVYRQLMAGLMRLFHDLNRANDGRLLLEWGYVEVLVHRPA